MSTQMKITYAWLTAGIIFGVFGLYGLFMGVMSSLLTIGMAALILWTTGHNAGGWITIKYDLAHRWRLLTTKRTAVKKKRPGTGPFKVIK